MFRFELFYTLCRIYEKLLLSVLWVEVIFKKSLDVASCQFVVFTIDLSRTGFFLKVEFGKLSKERLYRQLTHECVATALQWSVLLGQSPPPPPLLSPPLASPLGPLIMNTSGETCKLRWCIGQCRVYVSSTIYLSTHLCVCECVCVWCVWCVCVCVCVCVRVVCLCVSDRVFSTGS